METETLNQWDQEVVEALPESPWERERRRVALAVGLAAGVGLVLAVALFAFPPVLVAAAAAGLGYLVLVLASPFAGLLGYLGCEFLRFGETVPALGAIHFQRLLAVAVIGAWAIRRAVRRDEPLVSDRQHGSMLALLGVALLSAFNPFWPGRSLQFSLDFAKMGLIYLALVNLGNDRRRMRQLVWTLALLAGWIAADGILRYSSGTQVEMSGETVRAGASSLFLRNSNDLALALVWAIPLLVYLLHTEAAGGRLLALALLGGCGWSLVCTGSRAGFLGLLAVMIGIWASSRHKLLSLLVVIAVLSVGWGMAPQTYRERMASIVTGADPDGSVAGRTGAWRVGIRMLRDRPLLGAGAGNFMVAYADRYTPPGQRPLYRSAHSLWFQTGGELGGLGILALGWFLWLLVRGLLRARRQAATPRERELASALLLSLLGTAVVGTFASILWYPYLYLLAGMGVVVRQLTRPVPAAAPVEPGRAALPTAERA